MTAGADTGEPRSVPSYDELVALGLYDPNGEHAGPRLQFLIGLFEAGATLEDVMEASKLGDAYLNALRAELWLLPPTGLTAEEVAEKVGVSTEKLSEWWRLLGMRDPATSRVRFSENEIKIAVALHGLEMVQGRASTDVARLIGTATRHIAAGVLDAARMALGETFQVSSIKRGYTTDFDQVMRKAAVEGLTSFVSTMVLRNIADLWVIDVKLTGDNNNEFTYTVVFVDIVDYTGLSQRVDGGELVAILSAFELLAQQAAQDFDGRLIKMLGDGAMLCFTSEHEAIQAALALTAPRAELPPRRAGVATGPALSRQGDLFGPVVNLAARLSGVAAPGEVATDTEPTVFESEPMDPVMLNGYDDPVTPYRVTNG